MINFTTSIGKEVKLGDILQGQQSVPVIVIFDEKSQKPYVSPMKAKSRTYIHGLQIESIIDYAFAISLEEFVENNKQFEVLGNILQINIENICRKVGDPYSEEWNVIKLENGNYTG